MKENKNIKEVDLMNDNQIEINLEKNYKLENKLKETKEDYLRLAAEFDNYKKRVSKEKEEIVNTTKVKMLTSILDIDNDISIAIKNVKSQEAIDGLNLILKKIDVFLKNQGIETIQTDTYDSELHEVISVINYQEEKIIDVVSKGYTINGKPFRYPKVVLGKVQNG